MSRGTNYVDQWMNDHLEDMVHDVGEENFGKAHLFDSLKSDSEEELYPGCDEGLIPTKDGGTCLKRLSMFRKEIH